MKVIFICISGTETVNVDLGFPEEGIDVNKVLTWMKVATKVLGRGDRHIPIVEGSKIQFNLQQLKFLQKGVNQSLRNAKSEVGESILSGTILQKNVKRITR